MATGPWLDDVRYYDVTPATIHYELTLDAFYVARADIRSPSHPHRLGLVVTVKLRDLSVSRLTLEEAIASGRVLLDRLIAEHRADVASLDAHSVRVFDFAGARLR
jgi:hypothetical protein